MANVNASQFPDSITAAQLREIMRMGKQKRATIVYEPFVYRDRDTLANELNELYSYEERSDYAKIRPQFYSLFPVDKEGQWRSASDKAKREFVQLCLDKLDTATHEQHQQWAVCLLYIAQGAHGEVKTSEELLEQIKLNVAVLRKFGAVPALLQVLDHAWYSGVQWPLVAVYLQIIGIIMIVNAEDPQLAAELGHPRQPGKSFVVLLFEMLTSLSDDRMPRSMPLQKLVNCLRYAMMICWGDSAKLEELKTAARAQANLPPVKTGMHAKQTMADLAVFERETVSRYYGFQAARPGARTLDDLEETLPVPILEGLRTLRTNVYVSLGDLQLKKFQKETIPVWPWPASAITEPPNQKELLQRIEAIRSDLLALIPNIHKYLVTLLKLLLAALPSAKKTQGSHSLLNDYDLVSRSGGGHADVNSIELSQQQMVDVARYREVLAKSITSSIIFLLKHSRVVHVLFFELISKLLVDNNGVLLGLRLFNQDIALLLSTKNELAPLTFLSYSVDPREQLQEHELAQAGKSETDINNIEDNFQTPIFVSWRNAHMSVDMLRIVQKLTKNKQGRMRILMEYKAPAILRRISKMPHHKLNFYGLKVLKSLLPYLGRKWRFANMKAVSYIYLDLHHRSPDAALLSVNSDLEGDPLPAPGTDEMPAVIDEFMRSVTMGGGSGNSVDSSIDHDHDQDSHLLSNSLRNIDLGMGFEQNYRAWLASEVFNSDDVTDDGGNDADDEKHRASPLTSFQAEH